MTQNRFKSWATWVAIAGAVWMLISALGLPEKMGLTAETWNLVLNALGAILVGFGILNNPTDKTNF